LNTLKIYKSSIINWLNSLDSSNNWETELSASVALPAETDEETKKEETKDQTDDLPEAVVESSKVFMDVDGWFFRVEVSHVYILFIKLRSNPTLKL
jgi:hypothetical protein